MIKNDRQYRVTTSQLNAFRDALEKVESADLPKGVDPGIRNLHRNALRSQHEELQQQVQEYEALQKGDVVMFEIDDLSQLPTALIKARIASNLTQRELGERIGVKEQQVQRWEANDYSGASLKTLKAVMDALGIQIRKEIFVPNEGLSPSIFLKYLEKAGIPRHLLFNRLLSAADAAKLLMNEAKAGLREIIAAATRVERIFRIDIQDLLHMRPINLFSGIVPSPRFKLLSRNKPSVVSSYIVYAHYMAAVIERSACDLAADKLPGDAHAWHKQLTSEANSITFKRALEFAWDHGVVVIPLRETGMFHGAVWKIRGRPVVILKQTTSLASRWLYDLLHEIAHTIKGHVTDDVGLIEEEPISPQIDDPQEEEANEWAEDVLFDGRSEEIESACALECAGNLRRLKNIIPTIANRFNVDAGTLANHMAFRLASEGKDWWGAANNLQTTSENPFETARNVLFQRIKFERLNSVDRDLVMRALTNQ